MFYRIFGKKTYKCFCSFFVSGQHSKMKREISSTSEYLDDDFHKYGVSSLPSQQIDCHLCCDNYCHHHYHHRRRNHDINSSVKESVPEPAAALLLYSSNIGYIVHTPPPPSLPPSHQPSIICYCSRCCSTSR